MWFYNLQYVCFARSGIICSLLFLSLWEWWNGKRGTQQQQEKKELPKELLLAKQVWSTIWIVACLCDAVESFAMCCIMEKRSPFVIVEECAIQKSGTDIPRAETEFLLAEHVSSCASSY